MKKKDQKTERRILGRHLARETTRAELQKALGGLCGCDPTKTQTMIVPPDDDPFPP